MAINEQTIKNKKNKRNGTQKGMVTRFLIRHTIFFIELYRVGIMLERI